MKEKTLVVLMGNARGGEQTWSTMSKHLIRPFDADLALLFGYTKDKSNSLYSNAKYVWEMPEYDNWRTYYEENCSGNWFAFFEKYRNTVLSGGIDGCAGAGAIVLAFRHHLKKNYINILQKYDRIILTRSDHYYLDNHPYLSNEYFYIVEGEDYGGLCDRHHIFPSIMSSNVLGVVEFLDSKNSTKVKIHNNKNPESFLLSYYDHIGILNKINRCKRVQFMVKLKDDHTRWSNGTKSLSWDNSLFIKYEGEYSLASSNIAIKEGESVLENKALNFKNASNEWTIIFCSSDPTIWDTDTEEEGSFAMQICKAPDNIKYLKIRNLEGESVIIPIQKSSLCSDVMVSDTLGWAGSNKFSWTAFHLGIYDAMSWSGTAGDVHIVPEGGHMGWGFGNGVCLNNGQYFSWGYKPIPKSPFEISVKCTELTEEEKKYLLKDYNTPQNNKIQTPKIMNFQEFPFNGDRFIEKTFLKLKKQYNLNVAVETGSCIYSTTKWLGNNFEKVYTVELNNNYAKHGIHKVKNMNNVFTYIGDSVFYIKQLCDIIESKDRAIFFLDAHWYDYCPLLGELDALKGMKLGFPPVIAIHDFYTGDERLGWDTYHGQRYEYAWIEPKIKELENNFDCVYNYFYNKEAESDMRGIIYLIPNLFS